MLKVIHTHAGVIVIMSQIIRRLPHFCLILNNSAAAISPEVAKRMAGVYREAGPFLSFSSACSLEFVHLEVCSCSGRNRETPE